MRMKKEANAKQCVTSLPSSTSSEHWSIQGNKVQLEESLLSFSLKAFSLKGSRNVGGQAGFRHIVLWTDPETAERKQKEVTTTSGPSAFSHLDSYTPLQLVFVHLLHILAHRCTYLDLCFADPTSLLQISQGCEREVVQVRRSERRSKELKGKRYHWGKLTGLLSSNARGPI